MKVKHLVASLPSYVRALEGKGVHVITVNDYLAKRDFDLIGQIHRFLGLTVGLNVPMMEPDAKERCIQCGYYLWCWNRIRFRLFA